jgi:hypothetical protein
MIDRVATCRCGQLQAKCSGEPVRISVCHCLNCQKRSGSSFAAQARWPDEGVAMAGEFNVWTHQNDSGSRMSFRFCPVCGSTIAYVAEAMPGLTAIAIGAFADPNFRRPIIQFMKGESIPGLKSPGAISSIMIDCVTRRRGGKASPAPPPPRFYVATQFPWNPGGMRWGMWMTACGGPAKLAASRMTKSLVSSAKLTT